MNHDHWLRKHRLRFPDLHPSQPSAPDESEALRRRVRSLRGDNLKYQKLLKSVRAYMQARPGPERDHMEKELLAKLFVRRG